MFLFFQRQRGEHRDSISASCTVVITSRQISFLPHSTRATGILILIGLGFLIHLESSSAVVA